MSTGLREQLVQHIRFARGGYNYGYELVDSAGNVVGTKSVTRANHEAPIERTYRLGDLEFETVVEFVAAYKKSVEPQISADLSGVPAP